MTLLLLACATSPTDSDRPNHSDSAEDTAGETAETGDSAAGDTGDSAGGETGDSGGDTGADTGGDSGDDTGAPAGTGGSGGPVGLGSGTIGAATYSWYVPACAATAHPVAVVYTMHGSGGRGADMVSVWQSVAEANCFLVVGLDSESQNSWNFSGDVDNFSRLMTKIDGEYDIGWWYLHGYSAGAHWTYVIGLANSAYFSGIGVYAGTMSYAEEWGYWPDRTATPIPVAIAHGTNDTTVPYSHAEHAYAELSAAGWPVDLYTIAGGTHAYDVSCEGRAWTFWRENL